MRRNLAKFSIGELVKVVTTRSDGIVLVYDNFNGYNWGLGKQSYKSIGERCIVVSKTTSVLDEGTYIRVLFEDSSVGYVHEINLEKL